MKLLTVFIFGSAAVNHGDLCTMDGTPCPVNVLDSRLEDCPRMKPNADFVFLVDTTQENKDSRSGIQELTEKLSNRLEETFENIAYTTIFAWEEGGIPVVSAVETYSANDFVEASQEDSEGFPEKITSIFDVILEAKKHVKFHTDNSRLILVNTSTAPGPTDSELYFALLEFFLNYDLAVVFSVPLNDNYALWEKLANKFQNDGADVGVEEILVDESEPSDYSRWFTEHELLFQLCKGVSSREQPIQVPQWPIYPEYYKGKNFKGPFKTKTPLLDKGPGYNVIRGPGYNVIRESEVLSET